MKTENVTNPTVGQIFYLLTTIRKSGCFFTACFIKKDGTMRIMNCRTGVKKHLKGGTMGYDALSKGLLPVYDMEKKAYRVVNLDTLRWIRFKGVHYQFQIWDSKLVIVIL